METSVDAVVKDSHCDNIRLSDSCGLRSSASLAEIKFIIKTSILPRTPSSACPSTKKIQKFLQNGGDSSFEQSMEFKPINALRLTTNNKPQSSKLSVKNTSADYGRIVDTIDEDTSSENSRDNCDDMPEATECAQNQLSVTVAHPKGEDNKRLAMNLNRNIAGDDADVRRLINSVSNNGAEKVSKRAKLSNKNNNSGPNCPLIKSPSSSDLLKSGRRSFSLTPSPSLFRKKYSRRSLGGASFIREKLVIPTIVITSTPIKDCHSQDSEGELNAKLCEENIQMFEAETMVPPRAKGEDINVVCSEDAEFSFICEPSETECGDDDDRDLLMDTSGTSSICELQPPKEPVFSAEPTYSTNSATRNVELLKSCQRDSVKQTELDRHRDSTVFPLRTDVSAFDVKKGALTETTNVVPQAGVVGQKELYYHNKENVFSMPTNKCMNVKRVKSATVRVLHALTVS